MSKSLVSVIIPAYNAAGTIAKTLESVFTQSYPNLEIIVINDGSIDTTLEVLKTYGDSIHVISTENRGVSHARNLGFSTSKGKYIQYLDADDLLTPYKIETQLSVLELENGDVAYGDWQKFMIEDGKVIITDTIQRQIKEAIEIELFTDFWCPPAVLLYSRRIADKLRWNEKLPVIQDARYLLDAALFKGDFVYTSGIMALYREGQENSLSQRNENSFVLDCYNNCKEIYELWKTNLPNNLPKKNAIIKVLRYCINRFSVLNPTLSKEAICFLLSIEPGYIPEEKGILRTLSKLIGYKNAEWFAAIKRKIYR